MPAVVVTGPAVTQHLSFSFQAVAVDLLTDGWPS